MTSKAQRNAEIVRRYREDRSETFTSLGREFGIAISTVAAIITKAGANREGKWKHNQGRPKWTAEEKRAHSERMAKWWRDNPGLAGRPKGSKHFADDPAKRADYKLLVKYLGAREARRQMVID